VISIRRISLGGGFRYLMESVAAGDGAGQGPGPLARYYVSSGTPPGRFVGAGLADLDGGRGVEAGGEVTEEHLRLMLAGLADPVSGESRMGSGSFPGGAAPVAGFDLTFSPSKSVSTVWALADEDTKTVIYACHRQAIEVVVAYAEAHVFRSRSGAGGIVEEDIGGIVAASFTHWSSRSDDPQLHDHLVVWNRARSISDGRWRTLDSRGLFKATTTLSEMHQGVLSDLLTGALGVGWEARGRRHSTRPRYEIAGVPEALMAEFSQRATQIDGHQQAMVAEFVTARGRQPTAVEQMRLRHVATVATRPDKSHASLAELTGTWRRRADKHIAAGEQVAFVASLRDRNDLPRLGADDLDEAILADAARAVVSAVAERYATYGRTNLIAEAHRVLHGVRFATPADRIAVAERIGDLAVDASVLLTPPSPLHVPAPLRRADGTSRLSPAGRDRYSTETLIAAEARLLTAARTLDAPRLDAGHVAAADVPGHGHRLSGDQAAAVAQIGASGRRLDVLVGPAGTGKSTAMAGLRSLWEVAFGPGSVVGLAPSAAAAEVLAAELGVDTENTAKWLTEHRRVPALVAQRNRLAGHLAGRVHPASAAAARLRRQIAGLDGDITARSLRAGQLVIVDEASLAGTFALDELVCAAGHAGAKVLLVGDWAQLSSVEAGGAFGMLAADLGDQAAQLVDVRRFAAQWEKTASVDLRAGKPAAVDAYHSHSRVTGGHRDDLIASMFDAWKQDRDAGLASLMIAADTATVAELNALARADRVAAGTVTGDGITTTAGQQIGVGDEVVTRQNQRLLISGRSWVKNGDRWQVTAVHPDGSVTARRLHSASEVLLPADYTTGHVELAYATTAHRAQGATVDTAHAMITPATTRQALYVAATRGRSSNRLYVDTCYDPDPATGHDGTTETLTPRDVLVGVLANDGADLSAHDTLRRHQHHVGSIAALAAEYQTIAQLAQAGRYSTLLAEAGLTPGQLDTVRDSPAHGALITALRRAESEGLDIKGGLRAVIGSGAFGDARDAASVIHHRLDHWVTTAASKPELADGRLIAGTVPRAVGVTDPDLQLALNHREAALEQRAQALAAIAIENNEPWVRALGRRPGDPDGEARWLDTVAAVATQRDQLSTDDASPAIAVAIPSSDLPQRRKAARGQPPSVGNQRDANETPTAVSPSF
jgi:conjugative relaxase-like TrwC/TraI family protein